MVFPILVDILKPEEEKKRRIRVRSLLDVHGEGDLVDAFELLLPAQLHLPPERREQEGQLLLGQGLCRFDRGPGKDPQTEFAESFFCQVGNWQRAFDQVLSDPHVESELPPLVVGEVVAMEDAGLVEEVIVSLQELGPLLPLVGDVAFHSSSGVGLLHLLQSKPPRLIGIYALAFVDDVKVGVPELQVVPEATGTPLGGLDVAATGVAVGPGVVHLGVVVPDGVLEVGHAVAVKGEVMSLVMKMW